MTQEKHVNVLGCNMVSTARTQGTLIGRIVGRSGVGSAPSVTGRRWTEVHA